MDDVCVQHEFHFLCIVERILTRIPVDRRMNTTRTERGPDFVPVVVHVPDHSGIMCVLSSTYARKNEANLKLFFLPGFCLGCSTLFSTFLRSVTKSSQGGRSALRKVFTEPHHQKESERAVERETRTVRVLLLRVTF